MTERVDLQEFLGGFIAESDELVAAATAGLLEIDEAAATGEVKPQIVRDVFRAMHTIKGLAGMMGVEPIVALAHVFESVLRAADKAGGRLGRRTIEVGLVTVRAIAERVRAVAERRPVPSAPATLIDELSRADAGTATAAPRLVSTAWDRRLGESERRQLSAAIDAGRVVYSLSFVPSETNSSRGITIATVRSELAKLGDIVKVLPRALAPSPEVPAGLVFDLLVVSDAEPRQLAEAATTSVDDVVAVVAEPPTALPELSQMAEVDPVGRSFVRVELERLDELQEQLAALVVSRFRFEHALATLAASGQDVRALREIAEVQRRQLRDLRRGILRARMVRVAEVLEPLWLLLRSLVKPGIKEARLEVDVRDAALDKAVADRLLPAIVHLVRNAVDHGIEPIAERERAGKPRVGCVTISCREVAGNRLELRVADDGRGIDRDKIARRAGSPLPAGDAGLLDVLATPGFSTRDIASETSGRGLGMDIVKRIIVGELGGELALETGVGAGTSFTLGVPLTIAIVDVFSFECGSRAFVVPVASIEEIVDLADHVRVDGPVSGPGRLPVVLCERRGRALPVVALGTLLRIAGGSATKALVIRRGTESMAFAVDRMLGRHEVVVRPIEDALARAPGIAGATDLGDGRPTLLLDLVELGGGIERWRTEAS